MRKRNDWRGRSSPGAVGGLLIAIGAGLVGWVAQRGEAAQLVDAARCPGALEWFAIAGARLAPAAPPGAWLPHANAALLVVAVAIVVQLAYRVSGNLWTSAASGLAVASLPIVAPVFGPLPPLALVIASATMTAILRTSFLHRTLSSWLVVAGFCLTAAIYPPVVWWLAGLAVWWMFVAAARYRLLAALAAGAAVIAVVLAVRWAMPQPPPSLSGGMSCLSPIAWTGAAGRMKLAIVDVFSAPTMFAVALALLGAFSLRSRLRTRTMALLAYVVAGIIASRGVASDVDRSAAPAIVGLWILAGAGLAELARVNRGGRAARAGAAVLVLLLPVLQIARARSAWGAGLGAWNERAPLGHERLTSRDVRQLLAVLPDRSVVVEEDALVDLLLRSQWGGWQRMGKTIFSAPRDPGEVASALAHQPPHVLVLPMGQRDLQKLGVHLRAFDLGSIGGLAEAAAVDACTPVPRTWRSLPPLLVSSSFAIRAAAEADRGPLVLYAATDRDPKPTPIDWPPGATQGYIATRYSLLPGEREDADAALNDDDLANADFRGASHLVRFELRRVSRAPLVLAVDVGGERPLAVYAQKWPEAAGASLTACPAFPYQVQALDMHAK